VSELEGMALPKGWRWLNIGEVIDSAQTGFACGTRSDSGIIQLRMNNVNTSGELVWDNLTRVPCDASSKEFYRLMDGDVVFNNTNSTALVGKSAIFREHPETIVFSNHFTRLRTTPNLADSEYFSYWLNHLWNKRVFEKICNQWVGQSSVKSDKLFELKIPLPSLPEQKRIAAILKEQLAAVDRARKASAARLEAARALPVAYLREIFDAKKIASWNKVTIGELVISHIRTGLSRPEDNGSSIHCLTLSSVRNGTVLLDRTKPVAVTAKEADNNRLKPGAFY
jgi:type I restriction enzyme S subunit